MATDPQEILVVSHLGHEGGHGPIHRLAQVQMVSLVTELLEAMDRIEFAVSVAEIQDEDVPCFSCLSMTVAGTIMANLMLRFDDESRNSFAKSLSHLALTLPTDMAKREAEEENVVGSA